MGPFVDYYTSSFELASIFLAFLYAILLSSLVGILVANPLKRRLSSFFIAVAFLLLISIYGARFFWFPISSKIEIEMMLLVVGIIPAGFYIFSRRETVMLTNLYATDSKSRFNKMKDDFLTIASHELRTPLAVINGFAEILVREKLGPLNDEQKRRMRKILMQGQRLNLIIDELLDMSRIRSGKITVKKDVFDLVPVLKSIIDDHQIMCEQQRIKLVDQVPDILPDVMCDLERTTQVVVNMLGNALKYSDIGSTVKVWAGHDSSQNCVRVYILDTGIGIDLKDQLFIFDEFYRVTSKSVNRQKGSGLGLSIVKQLVEAQGGHVEVVSEGLGKGSCFYFTIPVAKTQMATANNPISVQ